MPADPKTPKRARPSALDDDLALYADGALSVPEAAEFTGLSRSTLYKLMGLGELAYSQPGRRRLIPKRGLMQYLASVKV